MRPYYLEFQKAGSLGCRWFLMDDRYRLVAMSDFYSRKDAAKRAFEAFWQRTRKRPIIRQKINADAEYKLETKLKKACSGIDNEMS
jgi:hypothetical protein